MTTSNHYARVTTVLLAASITACGGSSGGGDNTKLECAEISGAEALLLSKVIDTKEGSSSFGTKALEEAGSYSENPLQSELFSKLRFSTQSGFLELDDLVPSFNPARVKFIDVENDTTVTGDDLGDYTFVSIPGYSSELFLIRKRDNAIIAIGIDNLGLDIRRSTNGVTIFFVPDQANGRSAVLSDRSGNVFIAGFTFNIGLVSLNDDSLDSLPVIRLNAFDLDNALPGSTVQGDLVSLDGDGRISLLGVDSERGILSYRTFSENTGELLRVVDLNTGAFRNTTRVPFSLAGSTYAIENYTLQNDCPQRRSDTKNGIRLLGIGTTSDVVENELSLPCASVRLSSATPLLNSISHFRLGSAGVTRDIYDNDGFFDRQESYEAPLIITAFDLEVLESVGKEFQEAFQQRYEDEFGLSFGTYYSNIRCSSNVCLGQVNGDGWVFDPRVDDPDKVKLIEGVSLRSYYPGNSNINFEGNRFSDGQRVIGEVDSEGNVTYKAEIATEVVEYVPLRKANNDPTSCVSSAR